MPRYVDLDNPKIIRGERDRFGLVVYHIPPDTPCLNLAERPKGEWIINSDGYYPYCSECRMEPKSGDMTDFCPNCGADMRDLE